MKKVLVTLIKLYQQLVSPWLGNNCRFYPSCSEYSKLAIEKYGVVKGIIKSLYRILRCNPFCCGGVDFP
jgi:putative membrane protein insertion efficiency factor